MPIPAIIDTDPGVDDIVAILFALASPELEIVAYNVSFGNTDLNASFDNILKVYSVLEEHLEKNPEESARFPNFSKKRKPIVSLGAAGPLEGDLHSAQYFHGRDGLGDIATRHPEIRISNRNTLDHPYLRFTDKSAVDTTLELLKTYPPRTITYVALGPLTTLALLMRKDSLTITSTIGRIVSMGGALEVPGNTSPVAEFNYFADPYAVKELLISTNLHQGVPWERFLMLPLDITTPHELPFPVYQRLVDASFSGAKAPSTRVNKTPLVHLTSSFLEQTRDVMLLFGKDAMELHDIVAMWCAIANPPVSDSSACLSLAPHWHAESRIFDIERTGELTRGMLVVDRREDESAFPLGATRSEAQRDAEELVTLSNKSAKGVQCINHTPGPSVLLGLLLERVWGIREDS